MSNESSKSLRDATKLELASWLRDEAEEVVVSLVFRSSERDTLDELLDVTGLLATFLSRYTREEVEEALSAWSAKQASRGREPIRIAPGVFSLRAGVRRA